MGSENTKSEIKLALKNIDLASSEITETMAEIEEAVKGKPFEAEVRNKFNDILNILMCKELTYNTCRVNATNKNKNAWKTLSKDITITGKNGKPLEANLTSVPASALGIFANLKEGEGISSSDSNIKHAANVWKTEAKTTGKDGKVLFSAIRHRNTRGTEMATKEIILAAAVEQYGTEALQNSPEGKVWEVRMGNIQLMSPPKEIFNRILSSSDKNRSIEQTNAFEKLHNETIEVPILDKNKKEKKIKLKLLGSSLSFNFGTNKAHYGYGGLLVKSSYDKNKKSLEKLFGENFLKSLEKEYKGKKSKKKKENNTLNSAYFYNHFDSYVSGEAGKYLNSLSDQKNEILESINEIEKISKKTKEDLDDLNKEIKAAEEIDLKRKKIKNLSKQILDLWFTTHGEGIASNPAAIQTRLAALLYLIGYPITFNCKSGKDRTGEVAAEINDLVLTMEANGGEVPDPYKELSDKEKVQASRVYDATQSDEIAKANTGFRGLKVSYKNTTNRMGKMKGSSKFSSITSQS